MSKRTANVNQALVRSPLAQRKRLYIPAQRDIIFWDFVPQASASESSDELNKNRISMQVGHEQMYPRRALVMTPRPYNSEGLAVVLPITSKIKEIAINPLEHIYTIPSNSDITTCGSVLLNQVKSIDIVKRKPEFIELCPKPLFEAIRDDFFQTLT